MKITGVISPLPLPPLSFPPPLFFSSPSTTIAPIFRKKKKKKIISNKLNEEQKSFMTHTISSYKLPMEAHPPNNEQILLNYMKYLRVYNKLIRSHIMNRQIVFTQTLVLLSVLVPIPRHVRRLRYKY